MPLDEQSGRVTQLFIGNQEYEINRLFYRISIGPAAFSAFMSEIFRPLKLKKKCNYIFSRCFHAITNKRRIVFCLRKISSTSTTRKYESSPRQIT